MKRFLLILIAGAMMTGASAQVWKRIVQGTVISATSSNVSRTVNTTIDTKLRGINGSSLTGLKPIGLTPKKTTQPSVYTYVFDDNTVLDFVFKNGLAINVAENGKEYILSPMGKDAEGAQAGEHAFEGTTEAGEGIYYFSEDYSSLRIAAK